MRLTGNSKGGFTVTLSQRNVRELYHMMQLANAQAVEGQDDNVPMLFKALGTHEQLVVQVETDESHYEGEFPDAIAIVPETPEMLGGKPVLTITPPWDDQDEQDSVPDSNTFKEAKEHWGVAATALLEEPLTDDADFERELRIVAEGPPWGDDDHKEAH